MGEPQSSAAPAWRLPYIVNANQVRDGADNLPSCSPQDHPARRHALLTPPLELPGHNISRNFEDDWASTLTSFDSMTVVTTPAKDGREKRKSPRGATALLQIAR
jgi:hypothetical protein